MVKERSRMADYAVYLLVRIFICVVQSLSWRWTLNLAEGLAWLAYRLDRRHRLVAEDNLRQAFTHLDASALEKLVQASYLHLTTMVVEMIRLPRILHKFNVNDFIEYADPGALERIRGLVKSGRPLLALTGHFGNWEILGYAMGLFGFRGSVMVRRLDNPYLDRLMTYFRRKTGLTLLDKTDDYFRALDILAQGKALGIVGDQDAGARGEFVNFFGRPASTFKSIALLSLGYRAPILIMGAARTGHPMRYRIYLEDVIFPEDYMGQPGANRAITQRYTDALELMVRRHPDQYFWQHRRWKHQPQPIQTKKRDQAA